MTTRAGRYEIFCVETGRGQKGSTFVCGITDTKLKREIGTVDFKVLRAPRRHIVAESPSSFREAFYKLFGEMDIEAFAMGGASKVARNLEWMVKMVVEKGLWNPEKEFNYRKEERRKLGTPY